MEEDVYRTIVEPSPEVLFKDKGSKFFGYAFPVKDEYSVKEILETLKKKHHNARHWCYAYQLGKKYEYYRANDDGEPSNSAGMPIYGQIQSFHLTDVLIVVVRYFGGTKLGVSGLINAYKTAAQMALDVANLEERTIDVEYQLTFEYPEMNTVMRLIKENNVIVREQNLTLNCKIIIAVREMEAEKVFNLFENTYKVSIKKTDH